MKYVILLLVGAILLQACKTEPGYIQLGLLDSALSQADARERMMTNGRLAGIENYLEFPENQKRGKLWFDRAKQIVKEAKKIHKEIDTLRTDLLNNKLIGEDLSLSGRFMNLLDSLIGYKEFGFALVAEESQRTTAIGLQNSQLHLQQVKEELQLLKGYPTPITDDMKKSWIQSNLYSPDQKISAALLLKLSLDLSDLTRALLEICRAHSHTYYHMRWNNLATLSAEIVAPGDSIEIISGMGHFMIPKNLYMEIGRDTVKIGTDGLARKRIKAPMDPGRYEIILKTEYLDDDGVNREMLKTLVYRVRK